MKIGIGSDHGGFELKQALIEHYKKKKMKFADYGTNSTELCDYPDVAKPVCKDVLSGKVDLGILICGAGIGMSIAANRNKGIRAALLYNEFAAQAAKEHNNANVLAFGGRTMSLPDVVRYIDIFLYAKYLGGRYIARNDKLDK